METPQELMDLIGKRLRLEPSLLHEPDIYLGANIGKSYIKGFGEYEKVHWIMSSHTYVKQAVADVDKELKKVDQRC